MKKIEILSLYTRDMTISDAGGSRTLVQLLNYLVKTGEFSCYTTFRITSGADDRINQLPEIGLSVREMNQFIVNKGIDILLVPEGYALSIAASRAVQGTSCRVISAFHNRPGYEKIRLFHKILESILYNPVKVKRIRALFLLLVYPLSYMIYTRSIMHKLRTAYNKSDCMVLLSERYNDAYRNEYRIKDTSKLRVIENGLSFPSFADQKDVENKKKVLLVVSRLDECQKRLSYVIKIWSRLHRDYPDWELKIAGTGRSMVSYQRLSSRLGNERIVFLSHQPNPEKYYREASIFLMTSAFEGMPMTLAESQQFGCVPIVMDSFASVHDVIKTGVNGVISPDGDVNMYEEKIRMLIDNPAMRRKMASNGIQSCKRFSQDIVLKKWVTLFKDIL